MAKTLLVAEGLCVGFGDRTILNLDRIELRDGDRIGLVGENGAGKTTLLNVLSCAMMPDSGYIRRFSDVALIRQDRREEPGPASARMNSLYGAPERGEHLSGGEETRRRIAAALSKDTRILLADEPTSDLDDEGVALLTRALRDFDGAVVLVSHDRALLDAVVTDVWALAEGKIDSFPGNYSAYRAQLLNRRAFERQEYEAYRAERTRLFKAQQRILERASQTRLPSRMGNSEARLHKRAVSASQATHHKARSAINTRLEKLPEKERPREDPNVRMRIDTGAIISRVAAEGKNLTLAASGKILLEGADFRLPTGARTALIGPNGCGKTTLIRALMAGDGIFVSPGVKIGLFDQDMETLDDSKTALENAMQTAVQSEAAVRTVLARLGLRGDAALKTAGSMSGGERVKVQLARLMASDVNLLILDEPTNHLDVFSLEALSEVLSDYEGTLLVVSHDRRFIEQVATRLVFFRDRRLEAYEGSFEAYQARNTAPAEKPDKMLIEMRMAALAARMAKPQKGDKPEELNRMYDELVEQLKMVNGPKK